MTNFKTKPSDKKQQVIFLGEARFPFGLASIQRMTLMAKALLHVGIRPVVISYKGSWKKNEHRNFEHEGTFENIDYIYTSGVVHKPNGWVNRNIQKLNGIYKEFEYLKALKENSGIDMAILSNRKVRHVIRYYLYSVYFGFPLVINFVELASVMQHKRSFFRKINDYCHDKWFIRLFDGALPISEGLEQYFARLSPSKPSLKLPILCDFQKFDKEVTRKNSYFLYCGHIAYREVINFILDAYRDLPSRKDVKLYMIVSGGKTSETEILEREINDSFEDSPVKLFSNIPYDQLVDLYINALALLIPLRPTLQDSYRFPHKIGEYLASGNPVITTEVGEIKNYFSDGQNALIAEKYCPKEFCEKMKYVLDNPAKSEEIGLLGKKLGLENFDYRAHGTRIMGFMNKLR